MPLFRYHGALLDEALKKIFEVNSIEDLINIIYSHDSILPRPEPYEIDIKYYCYDDRIDWKTYLVIVNSKNSKIGKYVAGFMNGPLE